MQDLVGKITGSANDAAGQAKGAASDAAGSAKGAASEAKGKASSVAKNSSLNFITMMDLPSGQASSVFISHGQMQLCHANVKHAIVRTGQACIPLASLSEMLSCTQLCLWSAG